MDDADGADDDEDLRLSFLYIQTPDQAPPWPLCYGWMDEWMDWIGLGWMGGWIDAWVDSWVGRWMDGLGGWILRMTNRAVRVLG